VVDDDGTILAQGDGGVLAFGTDGTVRAVARQRDAEAAPIALRPFTDEGDAADAAPDFAGPAGMTADDGYVAMTVDSGLTGSRPPAYGWAGTHLPGQQAIVDGSASISSVVRLVTPNGRVTTAAWSVRSSAVRDGWLYLLADKVSGPTLKHEYLIGRLKLPAS
jgi:hypothetical protein